MTLSRPFAAALLAVPFFAASPSVLPASADSFTVSDVLGAQGGAMSVTIPEIQVVDGNMSEADIRALFEGGDPAAMAATLSSWDAASLTIPEFRYSQVMKVPDQPDVTVEMVYRNLTIEGLQDGVAQSSRLEGGDFKSSGAEGVNGTFGTLTTGRIDFAAVAGFYAGGGGEMKTIYSDVAFEGATLSGLQGFACDIGRMTTGEFRARPLQTSFVELMTMAESMEGMQGAQKPSPAELQKFVGIYTDLFQGLETSPTTIDGMSCKLTDEEGRPVSFSIGKMTIGGFGKGRYPAITMNDLDTTVVGDGFVKIGEVLFKGMDLNGALDAVKSAGNTLSDAWFEQNFRKLIPSFEGFALKGMSIDVPDEANAGKRIKGSLGAFDLTLKAYQLGIPTDISIAIENLAADLPADSTDVELAKIKALGYERIQMNAAARLHWDEATETITIDEVSTGGVDMGTVSFTAVLGNAGKGLFAEDPMAMQASAMGLSVKQVSVSADDDGLAQRLFAMVGKEQGQEPGAVRTQVSGMAAGMIPMMMGGTEQAQQVANAVMTFLNGGTSLKITAIAKEAAGLGLMEFMAAQENPAALVEKVDLSAEAK